MSKICIVSPSLQLGGIERSLSILANQFVKKGHEVHFIKIFPFEDFYQLDNRIKVYTPPFNFSKKGESAVKNILYYVRVLSPVGGYIKNLIRTIKPDTVLSYGDWFPHLIMLGLKNKFPFYYSNRSNPRIKYTKSIEFIRNLAYKLTPPTGVIAQTSQAKDRKVKLLGNRTKIKIVPNPAPNFNELNCEKENWIISVGRLHKEKGFIRLMEAFSKIKDRSDWKLVLVGDGIHAKEIMGMSEVYGIQDSVVFLGKVLDVQSVLCKSKIFAFGSHHEGFPNALLEGACAGLACVSFDIVAGPRDIISNGENGFLIEDGNLDEMTRILQYLINNESEIKRLGEAAKKSSDRFNADKITNEILNFILQKTTDS